MSFTFSNAQTLNVALHLWSAAVVLILLASYRSFMLEIKASRTFYASTWVAMVALFAYAIYFFRGVNDTLGIILQVVFYIGLYTLLYLFIRYVVVQIQEQKEVSPIVPIVTLIFCVISAMAWCLSLFDDNFAVLQSEEPYFGPLFWIANIAQIMLVIISLFLLIVNRRVLKMRQVLVLLSMPVMMLIATFLDPYIQGVRLLGPCAMIALLIIYTQHHLDMANTYQRGQFDDMQSRLTLAAGRMQPHYIYNVLTTIYYLIDENPEKAQTAVGTFSDYLRNTLEAMERDELVSFSWELSQVRNYFNLEKLRFGDRLTMVYDIEVEDFMIPPLTIQPLVENAVKHGLAAKEEGGSVRLITRRLMDGGVQLRVVDDGVGFDIESLTRLDVTHEGIGNVRERIKLLCNGDMTITSAPGKGTSVMITMRHGKG